jgi:MinD-like ATPase involved in chromosome partitioning or flagellar assembly
MKAISFFSYKGGVGRTMALTNMAMRLVEFGKSVMILDFDLEAPGVPFKMKRYVTNDQVKSGIVDYIHEFSKLGRIADIKDYVMTLPKNNLGDENMWFLPAGNSNADDYWQKLSSISWSDMFYKEGGGGLRFFLDLKEKIKKEYNPDFLLIDSRTGITELSGISLKILADEIVVLFVNNEENIYGTERVMQFLNKKDETDKANAPTTHLVLTRINKSKKEKPLDYKKEYDLINKIKKRLVNGEDAKNLDISVVHTDERLQHNEQLGFAHSHNENSVGIFEEHILLFDKIFKNSSQLKIGRNRTMQKRLNFYFID